MRNLFRVLVMIPLLMGCELDPAIRYYEKPTIEKIEISPALESVTAADDIAVTASVNSPFGRGFVSVKYWVCDNSWGDETPEMKFENKTEDLYIKVVPDNPEEEVTWKKLASVKHTYVYTCSNCGFATSTKPQTCPSCEEPSATFNSSNFTIEEGKTIKFETVIPKQNAGKFVKFVIFCTSEYGIYSYSDYYTYTVKP